MTRSISRILALLVLTALALAPRVTMGDEVYRWVDEKGVTHYTNKPQGPGIEPAELPRITRGEVKLTSGKPLFTCKNHGDVNCDAGADVDGSVICHDGFKDAAARFRFTCNSPKLEVADISQPDPSGAFSVFVRNSKPVSAANPEVFFRGPYDDIKLEGPESIEAFGVGEFLYHPQDGAATYLRVDKNHIRIACANCP